MLNRISASVEDSSVVTGKTNEANLMIISVSFFEAQEGEVLNISDQVLRKITVIDHF